MTRTATAPISRLLGAALGVGIVSIASWNLARGQAPKPIPPSRVIDVESLLEPSPGSAPPRFTALRVDDSGIYVWVESGRSRLAGQTETTIVKIAEAGVLARSSPLPPGARLTQTGEFGVDPAGNVWFVRTAPSRDRNREAVVLVQADPYGEILEEFPLADQPASLTIDGNGRPALLTWKGEIVAPAAPSASIARANPLGRVPREGRRPSWPLLEAAAEGGFVVTDGVTGLTEKVNGPAPNERRPIDSAETQLMLRAARERAASRAEAGGGPSSSRETTLRGSCADESGRLYFTLMGLRPSAGVVAVRLGADGVGLPPLRLEAIQDKERPDFFGRPRPSSGEAALMFPQDLAVWKDQAFVLGIHGLLAIYPVK